MKDKLKSKILLYTIFIAQPRLPGTIFQPKLLIIIYTQEIVAFYWVDFHTVLKFLASFPLIP
ncbi:hypothetical protein BpHYR1_039555 [Brachionus plicatilis]|uniref:Uncharacterized protein n=1 Tax=Brachionus plicatilis TaxID=10195 RepID=A0A3M7RSU7_BRAPC|nr:hypothetical protein BpHYR1_039555 [Brachionus plicatilis]